MIILGISPEYFLDYMSLDEINCILKAENEKEKRGLEKQRLSWFHTYRAFGCDIKKPEDIVLFNWEQKTPKISKPLTKQQIEKKTKQAQKWLGKHQ